MLSIPSPSYLAGRLKPARVIVLHTAQCPCEPGRAEAVMRFLSNPSVRASAHYCTDPTATVAGVSEPDTAWAAPGLNADGIQIEQAGFAEFGSGPINRDRYPTWHTYYGGTWPNWTDPGPARMLREQTATLVADICRRQGFPAKLLEPADLLAGHRGITDHARVTAAYGQGDHWDCGGSYPLAELVATVGQSLTGQLNPPTTEDDDDMPDYLLRAPDQDKGTVVARYPNGVLRGITYQEFQHITAKGIPMLALDHQNWVNVQGQIT